MHVKQLNSAFLSRLLRINFLLLKHSFLKNRRLFEQTLEFDQCFSTNNEMIKKQKCEKSKSKLLV